MATLTLTKVFLNRLDNGESVAAPSTDRGQSYSMDGEVRSYAGGRQRFFGTTGEHGTFQVTLRRLTLAQVATLRTWKGLAVQLRDRRGQSITGTFTTVTLKEWPDLLYDAAITINLVTYPDEV